MSVDQLISAFRVLILLLAAHFTTLLFPSRLFGEIQKRVWLRAVVYIVLAWVYYIGTTILADYFKR